MVVKEHQPLEDLVRLMDLKRYAPIRDRIRAVVLGLKGQDAPQIARTLDRHFRWVPRWVYRYRDEGLAGLMDRRRQARPTRLPAERQAAFEARLEAGPQPEDRICRFRREDLRRILLGGVPSDLQPLRGQPVDASSGLCIPVSPAPA